MSSDPQAKTSTNGDDLSQLTPKVAKDQAFQWGLQRSEGWTPSGLFTLREAMKLYGLKRHQIYAAGNRGELHTVQRGGQGREYYLEFELVKLAQEIGVLYSESSAA